MKLVYMPLSWLAAAARAALPWTLIGVLVFGGWRYFTRPYQAGALEFDPNIVSQTAGGVHGVAATDMDVDGDIDIVTTGLDGTKVYINDGQEKFEVKIVDDKDGERVQVIDVNKDGTQDLVVTLTNSPYSFIWYDNRGGLEFKGTTLGFGKQAAAYAGDIDGDSDIDFVTAMNDGGNIILQRWMNESGSFSSTTLDANSGVTAVTIGDLDGNGYQDIVTGGTKGLQRWQTTNGTSWSRTDIDDDNGNKTHVVIADVDKDGKLDVVTGDVSENVVAWYKNLGDSWERKALSGAADAKTVAVRDLDEDGDEDIIVAGQDNNTVYWYENNGKSDFTQRTAVSDVAGVYAVAINDIDSDNDFDIVTGDFVRGRLWWYERVRAKPVATKPTNIKQAADGSGRVTFETEVSDSDSDPTRLRIQYSLDGVRWDKPWLTKVTASTGKVDLKNSNGYQVGSKDAIDTGNSQKVKLTFTWDTKSSENTGGPLRGDIADVKIRVMPRDNTSVGTAAISNSFRVDLAAPENLRLKIASITSDQAELTWKAPFDSSELSYKIFYGTDAKAVLEQRSDFVASDTTSVTISDLTEDQTYTFKLFATDAFGNTAGAPSVRGSTTAVSSPEATPPFEQPPGEPSTPSEVEEPTPAVGLPVTPGPSPTATPKPTPPTTLADNAAPVADAGVDQVVNPSALVILDGTASDDTDRDSLVYSWRQISGPRVELLSVRTATPSFSAGEAGATYIFQLTVRDPRGASALDTVTVAVKELPESTTVPVQVNEPAQPTPVPASEWAGWLSILRWLNLLLFAAAVLSTSISLATRASHGLRRRRFAGSGGRRANMAGKVINVQTGEAVAGVQVLIYAEDGKLKKTERTNAQGEFPTLLPAGRYTLDIKHDGFAFAPARASLPAAESAVIYTGGVLNVPSGNKPIAIVVPLKPVGTPVGSLRTRFLHQWQFTQRVGRLVSWPLFSAGALLNTFLVFRSPDVEYLTIEILYVILVVIKVILEVRIRPAYGFVRDAITHVPIDLATVRLYEAGTNRLLMTRVTNAHGKFFALPSAGTYTITITKQGYAVFSKPNVQITGDVDSALQITADLMPVAPKAMLPAV